MNLIWSKNPWKTNVINVHDVRGCFASLLGVHESGRRRELAVPGLAILETAQEARSMERST